MGHHAFKHFVHDGWEDTLIVVGAEGTVDLGESVDAGAGEHTTGYIDHLEVLGAGERGDVAGLGADVVGYGGLEPGDVEMCSWVLLEVLDGFDGRVDVPSLYISFLTPPIRVYLIAR